MPDFPFLYSAYFFAAAEVLLYCPLAWMVVIFRVRKHSWRLLHRYWLLVPVFGAYLLYLVRPVRFPPGAFARAHLCVLFSTAHWAVMFLLVDRRILRWALRRQTKDAPVPGRIRKRDIAAMLIPAILIYVMMWFVFADSADAIKGMMQ